MTPAQTVIRYTGRHPRRTIRIGLMTAALAGGAARASRAAGHVGNATAPVKRATGDRRVHRESRRAVRHAARGLRRAERVGAANAFDDRCVTRELRKAGLHASRAARLTVAPPPRHRVLRTAVLVAAAAGLAGAMAARRAVRAGSYIAAAPAEPMVGDVGQAERPAH